MTEEAIVFVDVHQHRLWYEQYGESGTPVMLVMGFGISGRAWRPQIDALREHHRVGIFDHRGIADSEPSRTPYDFSVLADDAMAVADHLGFESPHWVGVSMGGMLCQNIAVRYPNRVKSLSLIATHPGGQMHEMLPTFKGLRLFLQANTRSGPKRIESLRRLLYPPPNPREADPSAHFDGEAMENFASPAAKSARLSQLRSILRHNLVEELSELRVPTLIVRPGKDILVRPQHSDRLHKLIENSRMLRFDDAGHGVTAQCAAPLNAALLQHFAGVDVCSDREAKPQ